jgi:hypothetical protein
MYPEPLLGAGWRTIMMGQSKVSSLGVKIESTSTLHQHSGCHTAAGRDREVPIADRGARAEQTSTEPDGKE